MLDDKDKSFEDTELHGLAEKTPDSSAEENRRQQRINKCEKLCKTSIKNVGRVNGLWFFVALMSIAAIGVLHFFSVGKQVSSMIKIGQWKFDSWVTIVIGLIFLILALTRISGNSKSLKILKDRNKYLRGALPQESDSLIREVYLFYCKKRCVHYWLTVGFGSLFMLCILYPIVASGVDCLANWGTWSPKYVKLFSSEALTPSSWKPEHKFVIIGIVGLFFAICQYFYFRVEYTKFIDAFEDRFGAEKIVDECLYANRMWKVDFRYKSFAFVIVCFVGCLFYLLFKRLICVIFDKSFAY